MPFSPKNAFSMAGTFAAVLVFTMFKEAYEDFFRHKQDTAVNSSPAHKFNRKSGTVDDVESK